MERIPDPQSSRFDKLPNKSQICAELVQLVQKLNAPKIVLDDALEICRNAVDSGLDRHHSNTVLASLYASCRKNRFPITMKELAHIGQSGKKVNWRGIAKCYGALVNKMEIDVATPDPDQYLQRIGSDSHTSQTAVHVSYHVIEKAKYEGISTYGKDPKAVAAAAIYTACQDLHENATQKDLADVAGVAEQTIRRNVQAFRKS